MKKKIIYYIFSIFTFCLLLTNVEADTINKDNVPNSTYIIGTHMFTRDTNDVYDGQLTTKLIMMASKTIEGDSLDDMIIYYKNARGKWTDALNGDSLEVPTAFKINYVNICDMGDYTITNPGTITASFGGADVEGKIGYWLNLNQNLSEIATDGVEIYYSTSENGEYTLAETIAKKDIVDNKVQTINIPQGHTHYYKVRYYVNLVTGKKVYSNYSNVVKCDNSLVIPQITREFGGTTGDYEVGYLLKLDTIGISDNIGIEIYRSTTENGEYSLERRATSEEITKHQIMVEIPYGFKYYYKVRLYKEYESETIYGEYSNVVECNNEITLKSVFGGASNDFIGVKIRITSGIPVNAQKIELYRVVNNNLVLEKTVVVDENSQVFQYLDATISTEEYQAGVIYQVRIKINDKYTPYSQQLEIKEEEVAIQTRPEISYEEKNSTEAGKDTYQIFINNIPEQVTEIEIYRSEMYGVLEFDLVDIISVDDYNNNGIIVNIPQDDYIHRIYKVRFKQGENYSYGSNELKVGENPLPVPQIAKGTVEEVEGKHRVRFDIQNFNDKVSHIILMDNYERIEQGEGTAVSVSASFVKEITVEEYRQNGLYVDITDEEYSARNLYVIKFKAGVFQTEFSNVVVASKLPSILGDVDLSGTVNNIDATYILKYLDGLELPEGININYGDVNLDGIVDEIDVDIIANYSNENITELPYIEKSRYSISYDLDGGKFEHYARKSYIDLTAYREPALTNPVKEGYTFIGWTGSNGDTPELNVTIPEGTTGDLSYTANWQEN